VTESPLGARVDPDVPTSPTAPPREPTPAQAFAEVLVDELVRGGVREAVLCPGSRNAPLSYALWAADRDGRLRLHVRVDERTAGFLALGLSLGSGLPVLVCCTSGTAVANLHPAVVEAGQSRVGVLALTADRPAHLRGTGANQTIDQVGIFAGAVRLAVDLPAPTATVLTSTTAADNAAWRSLVCRALAAARIGPVHLNLQLADPLAPAAAPGTLLAGLPAGTLPAETVPAETVPAGTLPTGLGGRGDGSPWTRSLVADPAAAVRPLSPVRDPGEDGDPALTRTLVVLGTGSDTELRAAAGWAERAGYPVVAEPSAWWVAGHTLLSCGPLLASSADLLAVAAPVRVVVAGRPTLGRAVGALVRRHGVALAVLHGGDGAGAAGGGGTGGSGTAGWADPDHVATEVARTVDELPWAPVDPRWAGAWTAADAAAAAARDKITAAPAPDPAGRDPAGPDPAGPDPAGPDPAGPDPAGPDPATPVGAGLARAVRDAAAGEPATLASAAGPGGGPAGHPGLLVVASSQAVRDLDTAGPPTRTGLRVLANRGAAGIDGTLSTAVGVALADGAAGGGRTFALLGDLAFVHDLNGLLIGPGEPRPDLTVVVADDDGGAIFATLEYGTAEHADAFERVFGTPTGADIPALCAGVRVSCRSVATTAELCAALTDPTPGLRVVHVRTDRSARRTRDAALRAAVHAAVAQALAGGAPDV